MALTQNQIKGVVSLFVKSFIYAENEAERKTLYVEFEDTFGRGIKEWEETIRSQIIECTKDKKIIEAFDKIRNRKKAYNLEEICSIRLLEERDFEQIIEIINSSFDMRLTHLDNKKLIRFSESGYSVVAYKDDEVLGVLLAAEILDLNFDTIYIDTFAVAECVRGIGIGRKMLSYLCEIAREKSDYVHTFRLQTDRNMEAYKIYKHWGFRENSLVQMKYYCI